VRSTVEIPGQLLRARRTAAGARGTLSICGIVLCLARPQATAFVPHLALAGFAIILTSAVVQLLAPQTLWLKLEESLAAPASLLIVGVGSEHVTEISVLWLAALASGVLARGGRIFWVGRALLLVSLALPIVREQQLTLSYACLCLAAVTLLLTCGRVTQELRSLLDRARFDADHDGLTGALSRAAFRARLDQVAARAGAEDGMALILLDVDNFGAINKSAGHAAGDQVLRSLVTRISAAIGDTGFVGRLGGDEFGAVFSAQAPADRAAKLLADLGRDSDDGQALPVSLGVALIPRDGDEAESLLRAVDVALRVAKRTGRNQLSVYAGESISDQGPGGAREALERLIAGEGLAMAVQPIVSMPGRTAHAYEALARFRTRGATSPLHWFALADELGVRDRLELTCLQAGLALLDSRPPGTLLSVNLSGSLLLDARVGELLRTVSEPGALILELTENSLVEDTPGLHAEISRWLSAGFQFAVDDMGVGYSGLRQVTTLRPTYLKLDRSLISGIDSDPDRAALVSAMLGYAHQTGGYLVAEGVETEAELEALMSLGVELVQGYYLGRPGRPWPPVAAAPAQEPEAKVNGTSLAGSPSLLRALPSA
jgi:diguanylate cyclase (GGDEF)-like protein